MNRKRKSAIRPSSYEELEVHYRVPPEPPAPPDLKPEWQPCPWEGGASVWWTDPETTLELILITYGGRWRWSATTTIGESELDEDPDRWGGSLCGDFCPTMEAAALEALEFALQVRRDPKMRKAITDRRALRDQTPWRQAQEQRRQEREAERLKAIERDKCDACARPRNHYVAYTDTGETVCEACELAGEADTAGVYR